MKVNREKFSYPNDEFFNKGLDITNLKDDIGKEELVSYFNDIPNKENITEVYWIEPPFSFASISEKDGEKIYDTHEVKEQDSEIKNRVLDLAGFDISDMDVNYSKFFESCDRILGMTDNISLSKKNFADLYHARRQSSGFMRLYPYTKDMSIDHISYNGYEPVFVFHSNYKSIESNLQIPQDRTGQFLRSLLKNFGYSGEDKIVERRLTEEHRIHASFVSDSKNSETTTFTLKSDRQFTFTPVHLYKYGTYSSLAISYLWSAVENDMSVLVGGGSSSGKTSTLEALLFFTEENQKLVTVENQRELSIPHRNWIAKDSTNSGNVDVYELLRSSLRQRPNYIVQGEIRGSEAETLFQSMNTGYAAYSTMHVETINAAIDRLTNPPINVPKQMITALDIICIQNQIRFTDDDGNPINVRRNDEIREIVNLRDNGRFENRRPFQWNAETDTFEESIEDSAVVERISRHNSNKSTEDIIENIHQKKEIIEAMSDADITESENVRDIITMYQENAERVLQKAKENRLKTLISDKD